MICHLKNPIRLAKAKKFYNAQYLLVRGVRHIRGGQKDVNWYNDFREQFDIT